MIRATAAADFIDHVRTGRYACGTPDVSFQNAAEPHAVGTQLAPPRVLGGLLARTGATPGTKWVHQERIRSAKAAEVPLPAPLRSSFWKRS
ncbi:hypothetical protein GCM10023222_47180 [Saccharopolyspora cebuensis]